jgi:hypothetical protein
MANTTGKKYGGRVKGTPNRTTTETKELLLKVVGKELDKLGALMVQLEPLDRINALAKLLPFVVPKQSEVTIDEKPPMTSEEREKRIKMLEEKLNRS